MNKPKVPVIMIHSVGIPNNKWNYNYLTCPYNLFENQLKWLKNNNYTSISLDELYSYMAKDSKLPIKPVVITFDDGFGDNWVFAYPLLKKYNMKATVYVNPEFSEFRKPKNNLNNVWNKEVGFKDLDTLGYLSWEEMKIMEEDGVFDIQSHTMTHTWYPRSEKIIDFRHPNDSYLWMTWNDNIKLKPDLQVDNQELVKLGQPVYENGRAIGIKRYFPPNEAEEFMIENYSKFSGKTFEDKKTIFNQFIKENKLEGYYETQEEYEKRVYSELNKSKILIEKNLDKEVNFLCWPGGAVTDLSLEISREIGYLSSTVGKDLNRNLIKNNFGENPNRINRLGNVIYWDGNEFSSSKIKYMNGLELILNLNYFKGGSFSKISLFGLFGLSKYYLLKSLLKS